MPYDHTWIHDPALPPSVPPAFADALRTYVSETNKTANAWSRVTDSMLGYTPHADSSSVRAILAHQILSERRFFAEFLGLDEPAPAELLPPGHAEKAAGVESYMKRYIDLAAARLPQLVAGDEAWWLAEADFFGVPRTRAWVFWRRVLHTAHHRTQILVYLRLAGEKVPATYGPSGDETWDGADPTLTAD